MDGINNLTTSDGSVLDPEKLKDFAEKFEDSLKTQGFSDEQADLDGDGVAGTVTFETPEDIVNFYQDAETVLNVKLDGTTNPIGTLGSTIDDVVAAHIGAEAITTEDLDGDGQANVVTLSTLIVASADDDSSDTTPNKPVIQLSAPAIDETLDGTTVIATVPVSGEGLTFSLADDVSGLFEIDATTGEISLLDGQTLDFETASSYTLTVDVENAFGGIRVEYAIAVNDVDEGPVFTSAASVDVPEDSDGIDLYTATTTDPEGAAVTYALADDAGGLFVIDTNTGAVSLAAGQVLDFETTQAYNLVIQASDGVNTADLNLTVNVTDVDEGLTFTSPASIDVAENTSGVALYTAIAADPEDATLPITYALVDDAAGAFVIDAATGDVSLADGQVLDFETVASYNLVIQASDGTNTADFNLTLNVTDVDEGPVFTSAASVDVSEDSDGIDLYTATTTDPEGAAVTYALTDDAGGLFVIDPNTGAVSLAAGQVLDFETTPAYNLVIQASDGVNTTDLNLTVNVTDVDEGPVFTSPASVEIAEGSSGAGLYTALALDPEDATLPITYALVDDAGGAFVIDANTGSVSLADGQVLDFETIPTYNIIIQASDGASTTDLNVTINVTDVDETPPAITLSETVQDDISDSNTIVDLDFSGDVTYTITQNSADSAGDILFEIDADGQVTLVDGKALDASEASSHVLFVEVNFTDGSGEPTLVQVTINVTDAGGDSGDDGQNANFSISDATIQNLAANFSFGDPTTDLVRFLQLAELDASRLARQGATGTVDLNGDGVVGYVAPDETNVQAALSGLESFYDLDVVVEDVNGETNSVSDDTTPSDDISDNSAEPSDGSDGENLATGDDDTSSDIDDTPPDITDPGADVDPPVVTNIQDDARITALNDAIASDQILTLPEADLGLIMQDAADAVIENLQQDPFISSFINFDELPQINFTSTLPGMGDLADQLRAFQFLGLGPFASNTVSLSSQTLSSSQSIVDNDIPEDLSDEIKNTPLSTGVTYAEIAQSYRDIATGTQFGAEINDFVLLSAVEFLDLVDYNADGEIGYISREFIESLVPQDSTVDQPVDDIPEEQETDPEVDVEVGTEPETETDVAG